MAKTAAPKKRAALDVLSLKITLRDIEPPIWRRLLVKPAMSLEDLHIAIQVCMGWHDSHLHAFEIAGARYSNPDMMDDAANERRMRMSTLIGSGVEHFGYTYDFGDNWEHDILIEAAPPANDAAELPACIGGKRNCPPEDCGGFPGYEELLAALADPAHPGHKEQLEWLGRPFDPEAFSVAATDARLGTVFRRKQRSPAAADRSLKRGTGSEAD